MKHCLCFIASLLLATMAGADNFKRVDSIEELFNQWTPEVELYVQSSVTTLDDAALSAIAEDLKKTPHWTVILWDSAVGAKYEQLTDYKALDFGVGQGLRNQGAFKMQRDEASGLANGSVLMISIKDRKLTYYSSPLQDQYGLRYDKIWVGNYDRPAVQNLRSGNFHQAIVASIDKLEKELARLREAELLAVQQFETDAKAEIEKARQAIDSAKITAENFQKVMPNAQGDLARANFTGLQGTIELAETAASKSNWAEAKNLALQVESAVDDLIRKYDGHRNAESVITSQKETIGEFAENRYVDKALLQTAIQQQESARISWLSGDSTYLEKIAALQKTVSTIGKVANAAEQETLRAEQHAQRVAKIASRTKTALIIAASSLAILLLLLARRRRNRIADDTLLLLRSVKHAMDEKLTALMELDQRRRRLLGESYAELQCTGHTRSDALELNNALGNLFILQSSARTVIEKADDMLRSLSFLRYQFGTAAFAKVQEQLQTTPVEFNADSDLAFVIDGKQRSSEEVLWLPLESFKPFALSMDQLQIEFGTHAKLATELLKKLEEANSCYTLSEEQVARVLALNYAKQHSGLRIPPAVAAELIPALDAAIEVASKNSLSDPVTAYEKLKEVELWIVQAESLIGDIREAATTGLLALEQAMKRFEQLNLPTDSYAKVEKTLLSEAQKEVRKLAGGLNESPQIIFAARVKQLVGNAKKAVQLEEQRILLTSGAEDLSTSLTSARAELAQKLGIAADAILVEQNANPDKLIEELQTLAQVALNEIIALQVDVASTLLEQGSEKLAAGDRIIAETKAGIDIFEARAAAATAVSEQLGVQSDAAKEVLDSLKSNFAKEVLSLGAEDNSHPNANGTIEDNLDEVATAAAQRNKAIADAQATFAIGKVLTAIALLDHAEKQAAFISARLTEVTEKQARVTAAVTANQQFISECSGKMALLGQNCEDKVVSAQTRELFREAQASFQAAEKEIGKKKQNPFIVASSLAASKKVLEQVETAIATDRRLYKQASKTVAGAKKLVTEIAREITNAVGSSTQLRQASKQFEKLQGDLTKLHQQLENSHEDWSTLETQAQACAENLREVLTSVRADQEAAAEATKKLAEAAVVIDNAKRWTSRHNVQFPQHSGGTTLRNAEDAFTAGQYSQALETALEAARVAQAALSTANQKESRAERQAEEAIELSRASRYDHPDPPSDFGGISSNFLSDSSGGSTSDYSSGDSGGATSDW